MSYRDTDGARLLATIKQKVADEAVTIPTARRRRAGRRRARRIDGELGRDEKKRVQIFLYKFFLTYSKDWE